MLNGPPGLAPEGSRSTGGSERLLLTDHCVSQPAGLFMCLEIHREGNLNNPITSNLPSTTGRPEGRTDLSTSQGEKIP